jgi:hypothetical protein
MNRQQGNGWNRLVGVCELSLVEANSVRSKPSEEGNEVAAVPAQRWSNLEVPLLCFCWILGLWAPWLPPGPGTAWLGLSSWGAAHGLHSLEASSFYVTVAVTCCALLGAVLRVSQAVSGQVSLTARQIGLFATCAPLGVLLPVEGAAFYLAGVAAIASAGLWIGKVPAPGMEPVWSRVLRESFPILATVCFLTMSWQYNAQWLMRGLLIAAGVALLVRALLPGSSLR